jgi:hypothetical protein
MEQQDIAVAADELTSKGVQLEDMADECSAKARPDYGGDTQSTGHVELSEAMKRFNAKFGETVATLTEEVAVVGGALRITAGDFRTTEADIAASVSAIAASEVV